MLPLNGETGGIPYVLASHTHIHTRTHTHSYTHIHTRAGACRNAATLRWGRRPSLHACRCIPAWHWGHLPQQNQGELTIFRFVDVGSTLGICNKVYLSSTAESVGLARTVYLHRIWPYICWFPCQKYRIYTVYIWFWPTLHKCAPYMTVCMYGLLLLPSYGLLTTTTCVNAHRIWPYDCMASFSFLLVASLLQPPVWMRSVYDRMYGLLTTTTVCERYVPRVGQNHIYTVRVRFFWQEHHQIHDQIWLCIIRLTVYIYGV